MANIQKQAIINANLLERFINFLDVSDKSIATYTIALNQFLKYIKANAITQPTREDIIAYRNFLKETGHKPTTVQNYITSVKLFFNWLELEGIYSNVAKHIKGAKIDNNHKKEALTIQQARDLLSITEGDSNESKRNYAILCLMLTGGLRTIEVVRANISDLSNINGQPVLYVQGKGKDEKTEYIKLNKQVSDAISIYLQTREPHEDEPLFTSLSDRNFGERLSTRTISRLVKNNLSKIGITSNKYTAHSTRHTAVTIALASGLSLEEVKQYARHKNLATTLIYAHNLDMIKNNCSDVIGSKLFN